MAAVPHPFAVLRGHQGEVQTLTFNSDETVLISGDSLGEVRVWSLIDLRPHTIAKLHPINAGVMNLQLLQDPSILATQGRDGTTHLWNIDLISDKEHALSANPIRSFIRHAFSFCRFSLLEPPQLQTPARDTLKKTDPTNDDFIQQILSTSEPINQSVSKSNTEKNSTNEIKHMQTQSNDIGDEREEESKKITANIEAAFARIHACSREVDNIIVGTNKTSSSSPQNHHQQNHPSFLAIPSNNERVIELCCCACSQTLACFYIKSEIEHQHSEEGEHLSSKAEAPKYGMCLAVKMFLKKKDSIVNNNGDDLQNMKSKDSCDSQDFEIYISIGYENGSIVIWDILRPDTPIAQGKLHNEPIMALAIDNDGKGGVSGAAEDKVVSFKIDYDRGIVECVDTFDVRNQGVGDVALRQDGKIIAVAGWDGRVRVFKRNTCRALAVLKYHVAAASSVCFSPKKYLIATGGRDGTIALWNTYSKKD